MPLGPIDIRGTVYEQTTPSPISQARLRAGGGPTAKTIPRQTIPWLSKYAPKRGIKSVVFNESGQTGIHLNGYDIPYMTRGIYARMSVPLPGAIVLPPSNATVALYYETMKNPNNCLEPGFDQWSLQDGTQVVALRTYDHCPKDTPRGFVASIPVDAAFYGTYVRAFPDCAPCAEMEVFDDRVLLSNFTSGRRDVVYTGRGGVPSRLDGWHLTPETHFPRGTVCPNLPDLTVAGLATFFDATGMGWVNAGTGMNGAYLIGYGDCFAPGSNGPGGFSYKMTQPGPPYGPRWVTTSSSP